MPNHVHLLIEMQDDRVSRIMQRVLTTYIQYHNRKYKKIGHLFQGRYKSILCQSDRYLGELVRYVHLNPVRAKMVKRPQTIITAATEPIWVWTDRGWWTRNQC
jgi:REP element-mobilizing transposase RayT